MYSRVGSLDADLRWQWILLPFHFERGLSDKVRLLYDRELPTARLVVRSKEDLDKPLVCPVMVMPITVVGKAHDLSGYDALLPASDEPDSLEMFVEFPSNEALSVFNFA